MPPTNPGDPVPRVDPSLGTDPRVVKTDTDGTYDAAAGSSVVETNANDVPDPDQTAVFAPHLSPHDGRDATYVPTSGTEPMVHQPQSGPEMVLVPGYRVLREIARGGMGRVLAARDLSLDRDVALKILLPGASADRFVRESKITARLPHPGIPPVHALGMLADGSPFLAMKLIVGQTLADDMKTADRPRLLQAFTQVCQAVGFAHSRGVIHRDLKPANIMVGAFGEVQVMDWGLARYLTSPEVGAECGSASPPVSRVETNSALSATHPGSGESTDDRTAFGAVMGTPAYMAPEQARGEAADARADVFALGGILCAILTGQPPFIGNSSLEVIERAGAGDLADANSRLDGCGADAELVELTKLYLAPTAIDRPKDAQAVADGLTTYLHGVQERLQAVERERAVAVAREGELRKRRRVQMALAAAVVIGLSGVGWVQFHANQALGQKNLELTAASGLIKTANSELIAANVREQQRFDLAMNAIGAFHSGVSEDFLLRAEEFREQRSSMLASARGFYEQLEVLLAGSANPRDRAALGNAYYQLAMLTDRTGSRDEALAAFGKTRDFWEGMAAEQKADPLVVGSQAATLCQIGGIQDAQGNSEEAIRTLESARDLATQGHSSSTATATETQKLTLIEIDKTLANSLHRMGRDSEALEAIEKAQEALKEMPSAGRESEDPRLLLQCIRLRGEILHSMGRAEEAIHLYEAGLRMDDSDRPGDPANPEIKQMVSQLENDVGIHYLFTGNLEKSLSYFSGSRKRKAEIAALFPAVWKFQEDLAIAWNNEADIQNRLGHSAAALTSNTNALAIRNGLVDLDPDNINAQHFVACSWNNIGDVLMWAGQLDDALVAYDRAIQRFESVVQRNPSTMESAKWLGGCWTARGDLLEWNGRTADALEAQQRALEIRQKIVQASPGAVDCLQAVAMSLDRLDRILVKAGRAAEAEISRQQAFELRDKLGRENTDITVCIVDQATSLARQGWQLHRDGKAKEAVAELRRAIELMPREPGSLDWKYSLGTFHALLSAAARDKQSGCSPDEAETESRLAVEILRQVAIQGYRPLQRYETDPDLQSLGDRPDFQALIHEIKTLVKENDSLQRPVVR